MPEKQPEQPLAEGADSGAADDRSVAATPAPEDWRAQTLARIRRLIQESEPAVVEEVKWRKPSNPAGVPVWSLGGILCTGERYRGKVKLTFARGAALDDPAGLFNSSLDGGVRRAIDILEGSWIDEEAFKALIRSATALNRSKS